MARRGSSGRTARCRSCARSASASRRAAARGVRVARLPARDGRDGEPGARARGGRGRGRAVRRESALDAGRRRRGARRAGRRRVQRAAARTRRLAEQSARSSPRAAGHARRRRGPDRAAARARPDRRGVLGATEETTTGLVRCARWRPGRARVPGLAVNEARTERAFNDHYGTGQSALDGILRATNLLLAGRRSSCSATARPARDRAPRPRRGRAA